MEKLRLLATLASTLTLCAALSVSCQSAEEKIAGYTEYKFNFTIAADSFGATKADATTGWSIGERVFVFFKPDGGSLLGDSYAEFTFDGYGWYPESYVAPGALGEKGEMSAVYVPYLDGAATPVYADGSWTIDGGDVYYARTSRADYTVEEETVYGTLSLKIPDGYVQFAVDAAVADDGDILACNYVDAYTCVTLSSNLSFTEAPVAGKKMTGHEDNGKVYFWGKMNECTDTDCEWTLTGRFGEVAMTKPASMVSKNGSFSLTSMPAPAHTGVQLWADGPYWATTNVGAAKPEDYGDYFSWGDIEPHYDNGYAQEDPQQHWKVGKESGYAWPNYKWGDGVSDYVTKYCTTPFSGDVDNKTSLEPEDDVAHVKWGGNWRMPTLAEFTSLTSECNWEYTTVNEVTGYLVTGKAAGYTDKSIFLPAAGYRYEGEIKYFNSFGYYWSSTLGSTISTVAYDLYFYASNHYTQTTNRYSGYSVRPVVE